MSKYLFLAGRIRALESKLLTQAQIERMVGAPSLEAAFRVLTELQYAEYLDTDVEAKDFQKIIETGLRETKKLIKDGSESAAEFEFLWKEFDLNNIKHALKLKLVHKRESLDDFLTEKGFSDLGDIPLKDLYKAVFNGSFSSNIPTEYRNLMEKADSLFQDNNEFSVVEFLLDRAHFDFLSKIVEGSDSNFLREYFVIQSDLTNVRALTRLLVSGKDLKKDYFIEYGTLRLEEILAVKTFDSLIALLVRHDYSSLADAVRNQDFGGNTSEALLAFEHEVWQYRDEYLTDAEQGEIGSIQIPMLYFLRRYKNAATLKFIMFAKTYNLAPENIYKTIKKFA